MAAPDFKADSLDVTTDIEAGGDITAAAGTVTGDVVDATTSMTVAGADVGALLPTSDEKAALAGTGTPSAADPFVSDSDGRIPSTDEKAALVGTGTPGAADPYVSDSDARMTDARTPLGHGASHGAGMGDPVDLGGLAYTIRQIALSNLAAPFSSVGSAAWQAVHSFNIANALNESLTAIATLDVHSLLGIAGIASFRLTVGGAGGGSGVQIDVDMAGVGVADRKCVTVMVSLTGLAADAARAITLEILDTAGLTYIVDHASVIVVRQQG